MWPKTWFSRLFERLLVRSIPPQQEVHLNRKNIFVFPTRVGFMYVLVACVVWLLGTNYQNNLVLFVAYFMFASCVVVIHHTFNNLTQLAIKLTKAPPVFVGEAAVFTFDIHNKKSRLCDSLYAQFRASDTSSMGEIQQLSPNSHTSLDVSLAATKRGILVPNRLGVFTFYPFGLLRCWTWLDLQASCLVYPARIKAPLNPLPVSGEGSQQNTVKGGDEFDHFKAYTAGDELKHIAWKASSKGKGLLVKQYATSTQPIMALSLAAIDAPTLELKLSGLSYWATHFYHQQQPFSADINGKVFSLAQSKQHATSHYHHVMACLATYNQAGRAPSSGAPMTDSAIKHASGSHFTGTHSAEQRPHA